MNLESNRSVMEQGNSPLTFASLCALCGLFLNRKVRQGRKGKPVHSTDDVPDDNAMKSHVHFLDWIVCEDEVVDETEILVEVRVYE